MEQSAAEDDRRQQAEEGGPPDRALPDDRNVKQERGQDQRHGKRQRVEEIAFEQQRRRRNPEERRQRQRDPACRAQDSHQRVKRAGANGAREQIAHLEGERRSIAEDLERETEIEIEERWLKVGVVEALPEPFFQQIFGEEVPERADLAGIESAARKAIENATRRVDDEQRSDVLAERHRFIRTSP
jgi:hypothetical protein